MKNTIKHTFHYSHPVEDVWDYLTKPELIAQWLMENDFKPVVGHEFKFKTRPLPQFNFDGIAYCKVLEVVPLQKLSYTWKGGPGNGETNLDSVVVWTLTPTANGTELHLEHSGFVDENTTIFAAMDAGWGKNIAKIEELIKAAKV